MDKLVCGVCGGKSPTGLHYGATTCYPCRAFFRRIPERKRTPRCKKDGTCPVDSSLPKHCPGCRFQKCLMAGMQLSQVLTEEQRRERFASSLRRKRAEEERAEEQGLQSDSSPVEAEADTASSFLFEDGDDQLDQHQEVDQHQELDQLEDIQPVTSNGLEAGPSQENLQFTLDPVPKQDGEEPQANSPIGFEGLELSRILGLQPHHQDLHPAQAAQPPAPPQPAPSAAHPPLSSSHLERFFAQESSLPLNCRGQPTISPKTSHQANRTRYESGLKPLEFYFNQDSKGSNYTFSSESYFQQPNPKKHCTNIHQHLGLDSFSGPSSTPSNPLSQLKSQTPPRLQDGGHLAVGGRQMQSPRSSSSSSPASRDVERLINSHLFVKSPGPSSSGTTQSNERLTRNQHEFTLSEGPSSTPLVSLPASRRINLQQQSFASPSAASTLPTPRGNTWDGYSSNQSLAPVYHNQPDDSSTALMENLAQSSSNSVHQMAPSHNYLMIDDSTNIPHQEPLKKDNIFPEVNQRPSVIQSRQTTFGRSVDEWKTQGPMASNFNHIEEQMTLRFIQERFDSTKNINQEPHRSSVIVTSPDPQPAFLDFEDIPSEERDDELPGVNVDEINVREYPDLKALCMTYLTEDTAPSMKQIQETFYKAWYKINIGEQVLGSFINFLKTQGPLPTTFMMMSGLQYRQRYLSGVCSLDVTAGFSQEVLFRLLRGRLGIVQMLASLTIFNLAHADKCVDFLLSDNDKRQWKIEANSELRWPLYETMLEKTPGSLKTKQEMMQRVKRHRSLIFTDLTVHMIMVLLLLFPADDHDAKVRSVHSVALNMLRGHLQNLGHPQQELAVQKVLSCVHDLPGLTDLRNRLLSEGREMMMMQMASAKKRKY